MNSNTFLSVKNIFLDQILTSIKLQNLDKQKCLSVDPISAWDNGSVLPVLEHKTLRRLITSPVGPGVFENGYMENVMLKIASLADARHENIASVFRYGQGWG